MAKIDTKQKLSEWIKRKLGSPVIDLEVAEDQIQDNIDDAVKRFTKYSGDASFRSALSISLSAGVSSYVLNDSIESVLSMDTIDTVSDGINILFSPMNQMYNQGFFDFLFRGDSGGSLVSYEMGMQYLDMAKDVLGGKFFTQYNKYTKTLQVTPSPNSPAVGVCEVYTKYDPGLGSSDIYDEVWVRDYSLALTKLSLGHIWGKYNGVPLPGGGSLNASTLMADGKADRDRLEDKLIKEEGEPLDFFIE